MNKKIVSVIIAASCALSASVGLCACGEADTYENPTEEQSENDIPETPTEEEPEGDTYEKMSEEQWKAAISATLNAQSVRIDEESYEEGRYEDDVCVDSYKETTQYVNLIDIENDREYDDMTRKNDHTIDYKNGDEDYKQKYTETSSYYRQYVQSPRDLQETFIIQMYKNNTDRSDWQDRNTGDEYRENASMWIESKGLKEFQRDRYIGGLEYLSRNDVYPDGNGNYLCLSDAYNYFTFDGKTGEYSITISIEESAEGETRKVTTQFSVCFEAGYVSEYHVIMSDIKSRDNVEYENCSEDTKVKLSGYGTTDAQSLLPEAQKQSVLDRVAQTTHEINENFRP